MTLGIKRIYIVKIIMKFLLVKALLLKRAKNEGFTLPIVMAIGLVMLLLSTVNLVQSGEEQLLTVSKQGASEALASAEFGIARYRELLNNNRVLAVYNLDQWTTTNVEGQVCDDITGSGGWADDTSWRTISLNENDFSKDFDGDGNVVDSDEPIGEYQIVDYIYDIDGDTTNDDNGNFNLIADANTNDDDPSDTANYQTITDENDLDDDGTSDARGILTVKGRSTDGNSEAQIQVEIPLGVNRDDLESLNPALWIRQSTLTAGELGDVNLDKNDNGTNNEVNDGNLVLYRASSLTSRCDGVDIGNSPVTPAIRDPRELPDIVDIDSITNVRTLNGDIDKEIDPDTTNPEYPRDNFFKDGEILLGNDEDNEDTLTNATAGGEDNNKALDDPNNNKEYDSGERYYYKTTGDLTIGAGESIIVDGTAKVILYVNGDLDIDTGTGGEVALANSSNNATSRYLEIHVRGNVTISGSGTLQISGLLLVPNSGANQGTVTIGGSATVNLTGSIWANDWSNSGTVNITDGANDYKYYSVIPNRTPKPLTYRPSNWETQEVQ